MSGVSRTGTVVSVASTASGTNAIPAEVGDVGALLVERLRAWKHAVADLEAYVSQTEALHRVVTKEFHKVLRTVEGPLREGHHFVPSAADVGGGSSGGGGGGGGGGWGVSRLFANIRANTGRLAAAHTEAAGELKGAVLPQLERLHREIKDRQRQVQAECEKSAKAVLRARTATQALIEQLGQQAAAFDVSPALSSPGPLATAALPGGAGLGSVSGARARPDHDPVLLKKMVLQRLARQVAEENSQRLELLGVQNNAQAFEAHVVQALQAAVASLNQALQTLANSQKLLYGDITEAANAVPQDYEFVNFLARNAHVLVDADAPRRTVDAIRFPNEDHASTRPLLEGVLARKGTIVRSYNAAYFVVTPCRFLHQFKDPDSMTKDPEPELSLHLPECTVGALSKDGKFRISGKDAGSALKGASIKHDFAFKVASSAEAQRWHDVLVQCAGSSPAAGATSPVLPVSPVSPATATGSAATLLDGGSGKPPPYQRLPEQESGTTEAQPRPPVEKA